MDTTSLQWGLLQNPPSTLSEPPFRLLQPSASCSAVGAPPLCSPSLPMPPPPLFALFSRFSGRFWRPVVSGRAARGASGSFGARPAHACARSKCAALHMRVPLPAHASARSRAAAHGLTWARPFARPFACTPVHTRVHRSPISPSPPPPLPPHRALRVLHAHVCLHATAARSRVLLVHAHLHTRVHPSSLPALWLFSGRFWVLSMAFGTDCGALSSCSHQALLVCCGHPRLLSHHRPSVNPQLWEGALATP